MTNTTLKHGESVGRISKKVAAIVHGFQKMAATKSKLASKVQVRDQGENMSTSKSTKTMNCCRVFIPGGGYDCLNLIEVLLYQSKREILSGILKRRECMCQTISAAFSRQIMEINVFILPMRIPLNPMQHPGKLQHHSFV